METNYCLILEDNLTDAKLMLREIKKSFTSIEHKVIDNKADLLLELASGKEISFILSDYNMPSFRGTDAYRILKQEGIDIPFLLITGSLRDEVAAEMLELGLDDYILKDRMSRLVPAIKAAIEKQRLRIERKKILDNLKESERKYSTLAEISPVGIFRQDATGKCVYVNKKYCELTGLKEKEALGYGYFKAVHQEDEKRLRETWSNAVQTKNTSSIELRFVRPDGTIVWVFGQVTPELDERGSVISAVGTITDITKTLEDKKELQWLSRVVKEIDNAAIITDAEGTIEWVNEGFESLTGYQLNEVSGKTPGSFLQGDQTTEESRKKIREGLAGKQPFETEILNYTKKGQPYTISLSVSPIFGENGDVEHFVGISTDITEKIEAEKNLKESEARLKGVLAQAPDVVVLTNPKGEIIFTNLQVEKNFDYSPQELFGKNFELLIADIYDQHLEVESLFQKDAKMVSKNMKMELIAQRKDGTEFSAEIIVGPMQNKEKKNVLFFIRDITEKKKIEKERKLFTAKLEQQVMSRTEELRMANDKLAAKNKDITDSINYALRLQKALFPDKSILHSFFQDAFVYLRPRDIVSGDFYWFHKRKGKFIIVAADCTGHGVPGAFMSVLGIELLNKIIVQEGASYPTHILELLDEGLLSVLGKTKGESITDGIDMSVCSIDTNSKRIDFAGAGRPLILISGEGLQYVKGTMFGLGGIIDLSMKKYKTTSVNYSPGDMLYLFSDGYVDQFGGEKGKKIMMKRLKEQLSHIHSLPCKEQEDYMDNFLLGWMGEEKQVDDVLIIGARLK